MNDKVPEEVRRLQDALVDMILAATDDEIRAELEEDGLNLESEAAAMQAEMARAAGKARMAAAKAEVKRRGPVVSSSTVPAASVANDDVSLARGLTKAARNGAAQSEEDVRSAAQDLRDIASFQQSGKEPEE